MVHALVFIEKLEELKILMKYFGPKRVRLLVPREGENGFTESVDTDEEVSVKVKKGVVN